MVQVTTSLTRAAVVLSRLHFQYISRILFQTRNLGNPSSAVKNLKSESDIDLKTDVQFWQ